MTIELIRHGMTALQAENRYQGYTDISLSEYGRNELKPAEYTPDILFVTTLRRTAESAEIIFPGTEQIVVPGLEEMNFGAFEGRNYMEMSHDPEYICWVEGMCQGKCPGGESRSEFCQRVNTAFLKLLTDAARRNSDIIAVVAHGGTIMSVMERFCTKKRSYFDWSTGSGTGYMLKCNYSNDEPLLELLCRTDHTRR